MDEQVIASMARWPDVPAVYGWLSLSEYGQWRLHPQGDALKMPESPGEEISSPQILAFMNRNYGVDESGQWFFQNGPQRVYVRLDAAPYIAHTTTDIQSSRLKLRTHTGLDVRHLSGLFLTPGGRLYAQTEHGAAMIAGRDLPSVLDALRLGSDSAADHDDVHAALACCLEHGNSVMLTSDTLDGFPSEALILRRCPENELEALLGYRRVPVPATPPKGAEGGQES